MTRAEWDRVVELLARNWPHQLQPAAALDKYRLDLDGFPVDQVLVAVETLYRDGKEWPPTGAQVLCRLADLTCDPPPFYQALRTIRAALRRPSSEAVPDESPEGYHVVDGRIAFLQAESPFLAGFVGALSWRELEVRDGFDEARLRGKYEDFTVEVRRSLVYRGLEGTGLPALERARAALPRPAVPTLQERAFARVARRRAELETEAA